MTYLEILQDQPALVSKVGNALGVDLVADEMNQIVNNIQAASDINLNKGVAERGGQSMIPDRLDVLPAKARTFTCDDKAYLGLAIK